jgi:ammonium transporter Rh
MTREQQHNRMWDVLFFVSEIIMLVLFAVGTEYHLGAEAKDATTDTVDYHNHIATEEITTFYAMWVDIHTMIFIGFGFLMVFLKTHAWSSVGFNFLIGAWAVQCGILFTGFFRGAFSEEGFGGHKIPLTLEALVEGDFCAAAALITMGALLGKTTFAQLFVLVTLESVAYAVNAIIVLEVLRCHDVGGAMTIHQFGAYFGLSATYFFQRSKAIEDKHGQNAGGYSNQMIAMVGTLFLFIYWPSFNGILASGVSQHLAIINTVLSITASCLVSSYVSRLWTGKFDMEVLLNSSLAGGVIMGAGCDILVNNPAWPIFCGSLVGVISAIGFLWGQGWCKEKLQLHDTCGVQFLHGIPGILGAVVAGFAVLAAANGAWPNEYQLNELFPNIAEGRSLNEQTGYQFLGIIVTQVISMFSGAVFGFIVSFMPMPERQFDDKPHWQHVEYGDDTAKWNVSEGHNHSASVIPMNESVEMANKPRKEDQ